MFQNGDQWELRNLGAQLAGIQNPVLGGMPNPMLGAIPPTARQRPKMGRLGQAMNNPMLQLGLGILAGNQQGNWAAGAQQAVNGILNQQMRTRVLDQRESDRRQQDEYRRRMLELQEQNAQSLDEYRAARLEQDQTGPTAAMRDYETFAALTPDEQQQWLRVNARQAQVPAAVQVFDRAQALLAEGKVDEANALIGLHRQSIQVDTGGGGKGMFNAGTNELVPIVDAETATGLNATEEGEKAAAKVAGKAAEEAKLSLGGIEADVAHVNGVVNRILAHPGLERATGMWSMLPSRPGGDAANAEALMEQLGGQAFLTARDRLKGAGTLTDFESKRGEAAYARMQSSQSTEEFKRAAQEFQLVTQIRLERAKKRAGEPHNLDQLTQQLEAMSGADELSDDELVNKWLNNGR